MRTRRWHRPPSVSEALIETRLNTGCKRALSLQHDRQARKCGICATRGNEKATTSYVAINILGKHGWGRIRLTAFPFFELPAEVAAPTI